jgi:hypothetical protein
MNKNESEKNLNLKKNSNEKIDEFISTGTNFKQSEANKKNQQKALTKPFDAKKSHSEIHVKKWVDYSTKYGLGYLLSDGSTGVYFNDSTKIIIDKNGE